MHLICYTSFVFRLKKIVLTILRPLLNIFLSSYVIMRKETYGKNVFKIYS